MCVHIAIRLGSGRIRVSCHKSGSVTYLLHNIGLRIVTHGQTRNAVSAFTIVRGFLQTRRRAAILQAANLLHPGQVEQPQVQQPNESDQTPILLPRHVATLQPLGGRLRVQQQAVVMMMMMKRRKPVKANVAGINSEQNEENRCNLLQKNSQGELCLGCFSRI
jgi:hypothetical protein